VKKEHVNKKMDFYKKGRTKCVCEREKNKDNIYELAKEQKKCASYDKLQSHQQLSKAIITHLIF
jgi:hypothetical protein